MPESKASSRLQQYQAQGYTIFQAVYDEPAMAEFRREADRLEAAEEGLNLQRRSWWFGDMLERSPALMWPVLRRPEVLDFVEEVVGPRVQLDNLTLAGFPANPEESDESLVVGWHRDRWSHLPIGVYERPLGLNALCYLQDLTDESGPLRIVPNSHVEPATVGEEARQERRDDEFLLYPRAGDVVLTHYGLLHSGTSNRSGRKRYMLSVYYNITWMKQTDTFDGPNCRRLIALARERADHRSLRLLGVDDHLQARGNSGFQVADEKRWEQWREEDRQAMRNAME